MHFDEVKLVEQGSDCNVAIKHCQAIKKSKISYALDNPCRHAMDNFKKNDITNYSCLDYKIFFFHLILNVLASISKFTQLITNLYNLYFKNSCKIKINGTFLFEACYSKLSYGCSVQTIIR